MKQLHVATLQVLKSSLTKKQGNAIAFFVDVQRKLSIKVPSDLGGGGVYIGVQLTRCRKCVRQGSHLHFEVGLKTCMYSTCNHTTCTVLTTTEM